MEEGRGGLLQRQRCREDSSAPRGGEGGPPGGPGAGCPRTAGRDTDRSHDRAPGGLGGLPAGERESGHRLGCSLPWWGGSRRPACGSCRRPVGAGPAGQEQLRMSQRGDVGHLQSPQQGGVKVRGAAELSAMSQRGCRIPRWRASLRKPPPAHLGYPSAPPGSLPLPPPCTLPNPAWSSRPKARSAGPWGSHPVWWGPALSGLCLPNSGPRGGGGDSPPAALILVID